MKINYKKAFILSTFFLIILLLAQFSFFRIRGKFLLYSIMGFATPSAVPKIQSDLLLSDFEPISSYKATDTRQNKLPSMPVIEAHGHLGKYFKTSPEDISKKLNEYNIKYFISLNMLHGDEFKKFKNEYNDKRIIHLSTLNFKRLKEENSINLMLNDLEEDIKNGTKGIKLWKNFGLLEKKKDGSRLKMNDPSLNPLFEKIAAQHLNVCIHTADPPAFFRPIDKLNERYEELSRRPEWAFNGKEFPTFDEVMNEREELFSRHRNINFIAVHFAEFPQDLKKASILLDKHPNVFLDIAARIDELGRHPYEVKDFFLKYQDRILFGMDGPPNKSKLEIYSRFLETKDEYFDYSPVGKDRKGFWKIYGLNLPKFVLAKIYFKNAERLFKL